MLAYFYFEVLPTIGTTRIVRRVIKAIQPDADMKKRLADVEECGSVANKMALADECINGALFDDAIRLYQSCMNGPYANDPSLHYGVGEAAFYKGDYALARRELWSIIEQQPFFKTGDAKLLYARALEALNELEAADLQYQTLVLQYTGEEARCRHALLLQRMGREPAAKVLFEEILRKAAKGSMPWRRLQKEWIDIARQQTQAKSSA